MTIRTKWTIIDDDIVISGMSGRFPECDNVNEFNEKLLSGTDLVKDNDSRWPKGYLGTYSKMGFVKDLRNFDASFFGAHPKLAERTDPIVRTLLETSVEAVIDAGICPTSIRGSETGVVVAVSSNEAADWWSADPDRVNGYEFLGCTRTMYSNRISFALDLQGPSYTMDSQSSSGLLGVQQAYYMLKTGMVDAVIVAGVNLVLNPHFNIMFQKLDMLTEDGKCKIFDADANGYARSEAGVAIMMQRKTDAKRVYATVVATESNCDGFKEFGCNSISLDSQLSLYKETYEKFNLNPQDVSFVEAHGYATREGDKTELNGIAEIFCQGRDSPLLVGSVKSNAGHSEPVGGLVSVVKVLLAMENGILPPNLHFKNPNPDIPSLKDGRVKVVDQLTIWDGKYAAINSFGIGGTNSHLVLRRNEKEKKADKKADIPRLMVASGRTESAVKYLLKKVENLRNDNEFCALLYNVFSQHIQHFNYRAFCVYDEEPVIETSTYTPSQEGARPICFVFSGMGSQWPGMCKQLLKMESFKKNIDACAQVLKTVDFDLYQLLNCEDKNVYNNVLNSFVGITCIQVCLVNILFELGIKPDFIVGHSIGELACAYADETLTLEQTVLATYWRGKSLLMTEIPAGAMAAIGLSQSEVAKLIPNDITVACHNSNDSVTISGPPDSVNKFVKKLQDDGIFAREVNSSGFAFHSQYIAKAGPIFESKLANVIKNPKPRTKRWISTSVPESLWDTPLAQYSSVAYHLNNLLSPVYFNKALSHVPENAVVIEIAPHALLQSILKGCMSSSCVHVGLVRRNQASVTDFLANIGRLFNAGLHPRIENLYPSVSYPVSRKTPMIQSLLEWDHSIKWFLISFMTKPACVHGEAEFVVDITIDRFKFLKNCIIDNEPTFPVAGYLSLIWEAVAKFQLTFPNNVPVVIENLQVLQKRSLSREKPLKFNVNILEGTGECEIKEEDAIVARAFVRRPENVTDEFSSPRKMTTSTSDYIPLKPADIYLDLFHKGYAYEAEFRGIKFTDNSAEQGKVKWDNNWTTFLESVLQLHLVRLEKQQHYAINHIQKVIIDPIEQENIASKCNENAGIPVEVFSDTNVIKSGGVEFQGIKSTLISLTKKDPKPTVQYYTFMPHVSEKLLREDQALNVDVQLVCENSDPNKTLEIAEAVVSSSHKYLTPTILSALDVEPLVQGSVTICSKDPIPEVQTPDVLKSTIDFSKTASSKTYDFIATSNVLSNLPTFKNILTSLTKTGFLLSIEAAKNVPSEETFDELNCKLITKFVIERGVCVLIRKTPLWKTGISAIVVKPDNLAWIDSVKMAMRKHKIDKRDSLLLFHGTDPTGVVGLWKSLRREPYGTGLKCIFTDEATHPYHICDLFFINYLRKGLFLNVYKNGEWGSYRHLPVEESTLVECEHAFFGVKEIGNFESISYIESRIPQMNLTNFDDCILCHVYYATVYPHGDVFKVAGWLPHDDGSDKYEQVGYFSDFLDNYPNHELCHVYYSSIYAHDIRCALGSLPYDDYTNVTKQGSVLGHEYSGRDSKGRRVFGMVGGGALATTVLADRMVMWDVPDHWSLEQASTIPRVYSVSYYALIVRGNLQKDESVYINAGILGLCLAAVNVALGVGARVFLGVNNQTEEKYVRDTFPEMSAIGLINLEEGSFEYQILNATDGQGVDLVFDCLNCHKRNLFIDALAINGRLVEFEKSTAFNESLGYAALEKNITIHKVSHGTLWVSDAGTESRKQIQKLVEEGVRNGVVKPIPAQIFTDEQVVEAFKAAQSGKFIGKVVIKFRDEEPQKCVIPKTKIVLAQPSAFVNSDQSFIVTTGLSEYGIQVIDWLISRGATKIVALSQYKPVTGYQCLAVRRWKSRNANVLISSIDASTPEGAENSIQTAMSLGPVGGIFILGPVAAECLFDKSTAAHFELLWKAKVEIAKNLDIASRKLCTSLRYFVGFSSLDSCRGSTSGYCCSAMEMVFEKRRAEDYPAVVIQNAPLDRFDTKPIPEGFIPLKFSSILKMMPELLNQPHTVVCVYKKQADVAAVSATEETKELMSNIADILGVQSVQKVYSLTFDEIGVDPLVVEKIRNQLEYYKFEVSSEEVRKLSFEKIVAQKC